MTGVQWVSLALSWFVFIFAGGCVDWFQLRSRYGSDVLQQDSSE